MASGPHLAILHHDSSSRFIHDYFSWMFRRPIGRLNPDDVFALQPLISVGDRHVALREVKSLRIRAQVDALPAFHIDDGELERILGPMPQPARTFRRMIERLSLDEMNAKIILGALGMTAGTLDGVDDADLQDLEFELLVRKKENNRIADLPDDLVQGVLEDGLDRAAEFQTAGAKRRGDGLVASFSGEVQIEGAYYETASVRALLWAALGEWGDQGLI